MSQEVEYPERPISEQLVDLHVYVVPTDLWRDHLNSAINTIINDTVSAGFVRVHPEASVYTLREELEGQLGYDIIPREYVFLKSVGRCLTRIRPKQEFQLKIKNFLPPLAYVPEVYLLEASPEYLSSYPSSGAPSGRNSRLDTGPSEFNPHKPMPPIRNSNAGSIRNGHDSSYSTAGTQTGYSYRSASPLTYNDSLAYTNSKKGAPDSLQKSGDANIAGSTQAWSDDRSIPQGGRRGPGSNARSFNPLTPVAGSEPPGAQTARNTPSDYPVGKVIHKTSQPPPLVGIQISSPSVQDPVEEGVPATWADRSQSPNRSIQVQTDYVHADIVMKTYRSDDAEPVLSPRNISRNPSRDPIPDPHSHNNLSHNSSRNPSYDPISQGHDPISQGRDPTSQGRDPTSQGHGPTSQGRGPVSQGHGPTSQGRDPVSQGHGPTSQGRDPVSQGHVPTSQGRDPISQGRDPIQGPSSKHNPQAPRNQQNYSFAPTHDPNSNIDPKYGSYRPPQQDNPAISSKQGTNQGNNQVFHNSNHQYDPSGSSAPTTGNYPDGPYSQYQQHPNVGPHPNHPNNAHPSQQAATNHGQSHPNTNSYNQPIHPNNGYSNGHNAGYNDHNAGYNGHNAAPSGHNAASNNHNAGGDAPGNRREAYQRQLDDSRTQQGYEPPLSASPPNSAGQTRVGMKKTDSRDPNKYNNTSDDSGISEMDEADRRRAEERLRGQPSPRDGDGGKDRRQDLLELERRRQEVVGEDRRKKEEEKARWQQWGGAPPGEAGGGGRSGDDRGDSGLAGSDRDRRNSNPDENDDALDELLANEEPVDQQELKAKLTEELEDARAERKETEKRREDLVKRAKAMQNKTQQRRTQARDLWKKRYFDEKKKTGPLEEQTARMRQELEALHRKIMSQLEQSKEKDGAGRKGDKPSQQSNLKIQAAKFQHEIEELQRRVENVKMKLTSEMKLRNQAETELRALRAELTQKKINMSLNRSKLSTQELAVHEPVPQTHR